jgi:hypothetical protein
MSERNKRIYCAVKRQNMWFLYPIQANRGKGLILNLGIIWHTQIHHANKLGTACLEKMTSGTLVCWTTYLTFNYKPGKPFSIQSEKIHLNWNLFYYAISNSKLVKYETQKYWNVRNKTIRSSHHWPWVLQQML